ncbi:hypothetical protein V6Z11_D02G176700 [Gossypium hirsutum]
MHFTSHIISSKACFRGYSLPYNMLQIYKMILGVTRFFQQRRKIKVLDPSNFLADFKHVLNIFDKYASLVVSFQLREFSTLQSHPSSTPIKEVLHSILHYPSNIFSPSFFIPQLYNIAQC